MSFKYALKGFDLSTQGVALCPEGICSHSPVWAEHNALTGLRL